jgi:hypothetical protein
MSRTSRQWRKSASPITPRELRPHKWFDKLLDVLRPYSIDTFVRASDVQLLGWLYWARMKRRRCP